MSIYNNFQPKIKINEPLFTTVKFITKLKPKLLYLNVIPQDFVGHLEEI